MDDKNTNAEKNLEEVLRELIDITNPEELGKTVTDTMNRVVKQKKDEVAKKADEERLAKEEYEKKACKRNEYIDYYKNTTLIRPAIRLTINDAIAVLMLALDNKISNWRVEDMEFCETLLRQTINEIIDVTNDAEKMLKKIKNFGINKSTPENILDNFFKLMGI